MTDRKALFEPNETPEDVATLYSWANLHGAKYRDFSASRAQSRDKARQRVQEVLEAESRRAQEAEALKAAETIRAAEAIRADAEAQKNIQSKSAEDAARPSVAPQTMWQQGAHYAPFTETQSPTAPPAAAYAAQAPQYPHTAPAYAASAPYAAPAPNYGAPAPSYTSAGYAPAAPYMPAMPAPAPYAPPAYAPAASQYGTSAVPPAFYAASVAPAAQYPSYNPNPVYGAPVSQPGLAPREDMNAQPRSAWAHNDSRDSAPRPAWLSERPEANAAAVVPQPNEDTLQGSRDRLTSRWFALKGVFGGASAAISETAPAPVPARAPVLAVFSLAGGVGKTSLVATLGRALSARGERVLLVDTAAYGLLPFFFGARDQRPSVLRTFTPPGTSGDAPIQTLTMDPETLGPETAPQEPLSTEIMRNGRGVSRIVVDLATASGATTRRVLRLAPTVLVPLMPDMSSVVSVGAIDSFFQHNPNAAGQPVMPFYVLNQFDASLPLHLDVREVLREQLGDRLLPFALRRTPAVSEALAEGMTVMDYAPSSQVAEDFGTLAGWVKGLAAPASNGFRGVRWSER